VRALKKQQVTNNKKKMKIGAIETTDMTVNLWTCVQPEASVTVQIIGELKCFFVVSRWRYCIKIIVDLLVMPARFRGGCVNLVDL
jgi:hypothetical protein